MVAQPGSTSWAMRTEPHKPVKFITIDRLQNDELMILLNDHKLKTIPRASKRFKEEHLFVHCDNQFMTFSEMTIREMPRSTGKLKAATLDRLRERVAAGEDGMGAKIDKWLASYGLVVIMVSPSPVPSGGLLPTVFPHATQNLTDLRAPPSCAPPARSFRPGPGMGGLQPAQQPPR